MITKEYLQQELAKRIKGYKPGVKTTTDNIIAEMKSILVLVDSLQDRVKDYDEALKRAKDFKNGIVQFALEPGESIVHYIFPELRESEDERIRKTIVATIEQCPDDFLNPKNRDRMFAYLEKQKVTPMPNSTELIEMWHKVKAILKEKDFRGDEWRLAQNAFIDGFARGTCVKFEKQKEQKPADYPYLPGWRKNRDDNKPELKHSVLMLTTHGVAEGEWLGKKWCQYRWSCELKDDEILYWMHLSDLVRLEKEDEQKEQKEQNPAEEIKDQRQIYFMIEDGRRCGVIEGRKQVIDNPEKYGLQKPAEWSEEDEKIMQAMIKEGDLKPSEIAWLKSLRPSWKPSEEQMDALKELIDDAHRDGWVTPGATELYEDLKRL